jgi:phosphohistidine phosphatase SixA
VKRLFFAVSLLAGLAITAPAASVVFVVRHAEKANGGNDPDLLPAGRKRADALARILKDAGITMIFVTELKRTQETAAPIAKAAQITPTIVPADDTAVLAAKLRALSGNALVVSHRNRIPRLMKALGIATPVNIPDEDYSEIYVVSLGHTPQLLRLHYAF